MKYSLSGSQNFIVIGFWNQWLPTTSRVSLASTRHFFPRILYPIPNQNEQSVYPFLDRKSAKAISLGWHIPMWLTVYLREYSPGENPSILKILSAGLSSLLNTLFGRDMHFEKERIYLQGWYWTKQYKGKYKFGRLSSVNVKEMIFILANGCRLRRELVTT